MTERDTLWDRLIQSINLSPAILVGGVIAIMFSSACNGSDNEAKCDINPSEPIAEIDSVLVSRAYPITNVNAGPFRLGAEIQDTIKGFEVEKSTEVKTVPERMAIEIPIYTYYIGNEGWVRITPQYDAATGHVCNNIGEIYIYSELFLTDKCIGAISSLEEFVRAYPDMNIRYIVDDDMFAVETSQLPYVKFLLGGKHYIGSERESESCTHSKLDVSDFEENSHFDAVRICK